MKTTIAMHPAMQLLPLPDHPESNQSQSSSRRFQHLNDAELYCDDDAWVCSAVVPTLKHLECFGHAALEFALADDLVIGRVGILEIMLLEINGFLIAFEVKDLPQ